MKQFPPFKPRSRRNVGSAVWDGGGGAYGWMIDRSRRGLTTKSPRLNVGDGFYPDHGARPD